MSFVSDLLGGKKPDYKQAEFKPYSVTTPFGSSTVKGKTITAELDPRLQQLFDEYISGASDLLPTGEQLAFGGKVSKAGQGLFDQYLGKLNEALNYDVGQATKDYYARSLDVLAPGRAQEASMLGDVLYKTGRTGAGVGVEGGYVNPEQYALAKATEEANMGLFLNAEDRARAIRTSEIDRALGGLGTALNTFGAGVNIAPTLFGSSQAVLGGGMGIPSNLGTQIGYGLQAGSASANAGANIANLQEQQRQSNLGFFGGLFGGAMGGALKGGGWSNLFKW